MYKIYVTEKTTNSTTGMTVGYEELELSKEQIQKAFDSPTGLITNRANDYLWELTKEDLPGEDWLIEEIWYSDKARTKEIKRWHTTHWELMRMAIDYFLEKLGTKTPEGKYIIYIADVISTNYMLSATATDITAEMAEEEIFLAIRFHTFDKALERVKGVLEEGETLLGIGERWYVDSEYRNTLVLWTKYFAKNCPPIRF